MYKNYSKFFTRTIDVNLNSNFYKFNPNYNFSKNNYNKSYKTLLSKIDDVWCIVMHLNFSFILLYSIINHLVFLDIFSKFNHIFIVIINLNILSKISKYLILDNLYLKLLELLI